MRIRGGKTLSTQDRREKERGMREGDKKGGRKVSQEREGDSKMEKKTLL